MKKFQKKESSWYERHGVAEPEHISHGLTDEELEAKFKDIRENTVHGNWKLQGNYLSCNKCPNPHGGLIPTTHILEGTDERGMPILTKRF